MQRTEPESKKSKGIALKASSHRHDTTSEDESSSEDAEDELALLTRRMKKIFKKCRPTSFVYEKKNEKKPFTRGESSKEKDVMCYECKRPGHMRGECSKMIKTFKKMRDKKARAMVATWSDEESDSSTESEEEGRNNLCLMAHGNEVEEVSLEENSFSINELELAYSHLLEKYSRLKHDNKDLKKKIETYVHDSTPCTECSLLEKERENLNDKHTSLNIEK